MIDIPMNAKVSCSDGTVGTSTAVIINPLEQIVTHFSVQAKHSPVLTERLVPVNLVVSTSHDTIELNCTQAEFSALDVFNDNHYIQNEESSLEYLEPFMTPLDTRYTTISAEHVPIGELAVRRGTNIEASDGYVGKVEAFIINPDDGHISHMILQQGHFFGKKEIALPMAAIDHLDDLTVVLKLSKAEIHELEPIPVKHAWQR